MKRSKLRRRLTDASAIAGFVVAFLAIVVMVLAPTVLLIAAAWWLVTH